MCGITGFFSPTNTLRSEELREILQPMIQAIRHRGPDAEGLFIDQSSGICLGHARLSVIDPTEAGAQPMTSQDRRYTIVFNGEIYNAPKLRELLPNPNFEGHSDTRILLELIASQGLVPSLQKLEGMFAFALWDHVENELILARDPLGKKPLYYGKHQNTFLFASELSSLRIHPDFEAALDPDAAALFLQKSYLPGPKSIYKGIHKLPPGHFTRITADNLTPTPQTYWSLSDLHQRDPIPPDNPAEACLKTISSAVEKRLISDVPFGAFLSGGIDSSLIVSLMCQQLPPSSIQTFALGFQEERYNEAPHARKIADHLGTQHHELILTPEKALETLPALIDVYDEPFADTSQLPTLILSRFTRQHVTVALSGDGGDELFGGYNRYFKILSLLANRKSYPGQKPLNALLSLIPQQKLPALARSLARQRSRNPIELLNTQSSRILNPHQFIPSASQFSPPAQAPPSNRSDLEDLLYHDITTWLTDDILVKVDRASMSCGLEVRSPLLDKELIELAWNIPIEARTSSENPKHLLKTLLESYVPRELFDRPKSGFAVPIAPWLTGPLRDWAEEQFSPSALAKNPILDPKAANSLWQGFLKSPKKLSRPIWNLLMLQAWTNANS